MENQEQTPAIPGVWATIAAGFEVTTQHLWLLAIPVALDLFLWLGPRLSFSALIWDLTEFYPVEPMLVDPRPMLEIIAPRLNMFGYLSVVFIGVPALMAGLAPEVTPLVANVMMVESWGQWLLLFAGLTLLGLLLAAAFYSLIAYVISRPDTEEESIQNKTRAGPAVRQLGRTWGRFTALALVLIGLSLLIFIPFAVIATLVGLFSQGLATFILLAAAVILLWIVILLSYVPAGLALNRNGFVATIVESVRLFQANLLPATYLLLTVVVLSQLVNWLLLLADDGSWLTLASILGHAFVSTALTAAMLIFYRDRYQFMFAAE